MFITYYHIYVKIHGYFLSDICISCGQCPCVHGEKDSLVFRGSATFPTFTEPGSDCLIKMIFQSNYLELKMVVVIDTDKLLQVFTFEAFPQHSDENKLSQVRPWPIVI